MNRTTLVDCLRSRILYDNCNNVDSVVGISGKNPGGLTIYIGFDLTADGLHVGHLSALMCIRIAMAFGHSCIIVLGGGTTYIGDPSGKNESRKILSPEQIGINKAGICKDILRILLPDRKLVAEDINFNSEVVLRDNGLVIVDNYHWLKDLNYIDFLRSVGVHFSVNKLIKMDSMSSRLSNEQNLSFIELNYPLLQAYDFYYLNKHYSCNCQIGGSDQWGNMLRGVELIQKMGGSDSYCITMPLVLRSDGKKMGKSEDGAVWLSPSKLDDESYWQYFRNVDDKDVDKFMKIFTDLSNAQINDSAMLDINGRKELLATEATKVCRGAEVAQRVREKMRLIFDGKADASLAEDVTTGALLLDVMVALGLSASKNEARRVVSAGGVKINGHTVNDDRLVLTAESISGVASCGTVNQTGQGDAVDANAHQALFVLSVGKRSRKVIRLV